MTTEMLTCGYKGCTQELRRDRLFNDEGWCIDHGSRYLGRQVLDIPRRDALPSEPVEAPKVVKKVVHPRKDPSVDVLALLNRGGEWLLSEVWSATGWSESTASKHLHLLMRAGKATRERRRSEVWIDGRDCGTRWVDYWRVQA